jgi:selenocysteine lyase/cysteine desulfurase
VQSVSSQPLSIDFGPFDSRAWLNCAHQGPLPRSAKQAAIEALEMKSRPALLADALFSTVPERLRSALAKLVGAAPAEIALTNSTSYGFNLLAQGLPWRARDEILFVRGDFPATIVPWLPLEHRGVRIRYLDIPAAKLTPERLEGEISARTKALCVSWVFSFYGHASDIASLGQVCREHGVLLFVNGSQAVGARETDVSTLPIDALSCCGFKWLCGPYATGFIWLSARLIELLDFPNPHWLRMQLHAAPQAGVDLTRELEYSLVQESTASAYDVFCAANFLNFTAWTAAVELLLEVGLERIEQHDQALVEHLLTGLPDQVRVESPVERHERSTLVLLSHREPKWNSTIAAGLAAQGLDVALRDGKLRVSPHLYNDTSEINRLLEACDVQGRRIEAPSRGRRYESGPGD